MTSKESKYRSALEMLLFRFKKIKPSSRTATFIASVLGSGRKACGACFHLRSAHSKAYGYCVYLMDGELCKCEEKQ